MGRKWQGGESTGVEWCAEGCGGILRYANTLAWMVLRGECDPIRSWVSSPPDFGCSPLPQPNLFYQFSPTCDWVSDKVEKHALLLILPTSKRCTPQPPGSSVARLQRLFFLPLHQYYFLFCFFNNWHSIHLVCSPPELPRRAAAGCWPARWGKHVSSVLQAALQPAHLHKII